MRRDCASMGRRIYSRIATGDVGNRICDGDRQHRESKFCSLERKVYTDFVMLDEGADDNDDLVVHVEELNDNRILNIVRRVEPIL